MMFDQVKVMSTDTVKRWAVSYFVRRTGYYAIQLYGKQLVLDDGIHTDSPLKQSKKDVREEIVRTAKVNSEPLRILVVGQKKTGKSSLINALYGEHRGNRRCSAD